MAASATSKSALKAALEPRLDAYEKKYAGLWLALSIAFMCALVLEITAPLKNLPYYFLADGILWATFIFDLYWRYHITVDRQKFFWGDPINWLDLLVVLSFPFLVFVHVMFLGLARLGRLIVIAVRLVRGAGLVGATATRAERFFRRGNLGLLAIVALEVVVTLTILVWRFESVHRGYPIHHWYDAAWWAVVTLFTVGYGDLYPKTAEGRVAAVAMMVVGIALFSWITAALASLFVENEDKLGSKEKQQEMVSNQREMVSALEAIQRRLDSIERALEGATGHRDAPSAVNVETDEGENTELPDDDAVPALD